MINLARSPLAYIVKNYGEIMLDLYKKDKSIRQIAKMYNIAISTAFRVIKKTANVKSLREIRPYSREKIKYNKPKKHKTIDKKLCRRCQKRPPAREKGLYFFCEKCYHKVNHLKVANEWWTGDPIIY